MPTQIDVVLTLNKFSAQPKAILQEATLCQVSIACYLMIEP